jgi:hypothetical protein
MERSANLFLAPRALAIAIEISSSLALAHLIEYSGKKLKEV